MESGESDEGSQSDGVEELSEAGLTGDLVAEMERTVGPTGENKASVLHVADPDPHKSGNLAWNRNRNQRFRSGFGKQQRSYK